MDKQTWDLTEVYLVPNEQYFSSHTYQPIRINVTPVSWQEVARTVDSGLPLELDADFYFLIV